MSRHLATRTRTHFGGSSWHGSAFIVEALVLLIFLAAAVAIFTQLFSHAAAEAAQSRALSSAVAAADDVAERFSADPYALGDVEAYGDLVVVSETIHDPYGPGTWHRATITVYPQDAYSESASAEDALFTISTGKYEPAESAAAPAPTEPETEPAEPSEPEPSGNGDEGVEVVEIDGDLYGGWL